MEQQPKLWEVNVDSVVFDQDGLELEDGNFEILALVLPHNVASEWPISLASFEYTSPAV